MKYKYYYNGEPAIVYCKKHPEFIYNHLTKYISVELKRNPNRDVNDIINEFFKIKHRSYTRYIINGMNLSKFCASNNLNYDAVTKSISRAKKDSRYEGMEENEIIDMVLDKYIIGIEVNELDFKEPKKNILKPGKDKSNS